RRRGTPSAPFPRGSVMLCSAHNFRAGARASAFFSKVGGSPAFFTFISLILIPPIQREVEALLDGCEPHVEVLLAEVVGAGTLRVFIDHPDGVTLDLCERVSTVLTPLRERYSLEVSSPGTRRPLTKPDHFRRFVGHRARVRTRTSLCPEQDRSAADSAAQPSRTRRGSSGEQRSTHTVTGELLGATDREVTIAVGEGVLAIPYADIRRSNLMES
ncbi:MAG: hypothetical protein ACYDA6_11635, partial [Solirubrobacteraceae bacterium]